LICQPEADPAVGPIGFGTLCQIASAGIDHGERQVPLDEVPVNHRSVANHNWLLRATTRMETSSIILRANRRNAKKQQSAFSKKIGFPTVWRAEVVIN